MANKTKRQIGSYAFIFGVLLAVLLGFMQAPVWAIAIMAVLGLVVAGLNIRHEEVRSYLLYNVALMVGVGTLSNMLSVLTAPLGLGSLAVLLQSILGNLVFFVAPGAVLIALSEVYALAQGNQTPSTLNHWVKTIRTA
ncbi:hypothetical protein HYV43_05395 [Candidatus Micrarchaeota archaeon]|nr:hypothetical protein [Candidatus Micrarchaeota archaeon]